MSNELPVDIDDDSAHKTSNNQQILADDISADVQASNVVQDTKLTIKIRPFGVAQRSHADGHRDGKFGSNLGVEDAANVDEDQDAEAEADIDDGGYIDSGMARSIAGDTGYGGPALRRSSRNRNSNGTQPSGSEYAATNSGDDAARQSEDEDDDQPLMKRTKSSSRKATLIDDDEDEFAAENTAPIEYQTRSGRSTKRIVIKESDTEGDGGDLFASDHHVVHVAREPKGKKRLRKGRNTSAEEDVEVNDVGVVGAGGRVTRSRSKKDGSATASASPPQEDVVMTNGNGYPTRSSRNTRSQSQRQRRLSDDQYDPNLDVDADAEADADEELDDIVPSSASRSPSPVPQPRNSRRRNDEMDVEIEVDQTRGDGKGTYMFRSRKRVDYSIPPPLGDNELRELADRGGRGKMGKGGAKGKGRVGWSINGTELGRYMGIPGPGDDSDSDYPSRTPRKSYGVGAAGGGSGGGIFAAGGAGLFPNDLAAAAGTPSNLGKVGDAALADADPLGVNVNVTFDEVGGLDDHINSLKEMTMLPLLYPEVFQRFNVTPPRGVLFHGPPGTGKTLLARALAASCRSNGKSISFFMRKGADCLSKWVGEAERQLRLLFEEARNSQPSIIFFDEIDGLAPVRSSKQDQIHASIVSTLLALMDGMDGRGQVIVIGATNRPDAIDPALRRPGRFDREFYFPLPSLEAREKILTIMTKKWEGWGSNEGGEEGVLSEKVKESIKGLARMTKGYGGADLRALCTEAALNAVQRRYPQVYKSQDRLLLKPETIFVQPKDFMVSIKKLVPSSARSASSTASPLPNQLVPLLEDTLNTAKKLVEKVLPMNKKRTALEEAEWEDEGEEDGFDREIMLQAMETLRVYRPRIVLHGPSGMGQAYVGAAILHHLEGYHVQTLDLGNIMGDSTRTPESAIVQLFVEAKRHQPSIIYIPSLLGFCAAASDPAKITVKAMLDSLSPTDPILLLAVVDAHFTSIPSDIRSWFGITRENRVPFTGPDRDKRSKFFDGLIQDVRRPPNQFPDGLKRRKRVHEVLPIAPPLEPRKPTPAELALQEEKDRQLIVLLKYRLGPILTELKRKFKRFTKRAADEYQLYFDPFMSNGYAPNGLLIPQAQTNGIIEIDGHTPDVPMQDTQAEAEYHPPPQPQLHDIDLERIHVDLYRDRYLTPDQFLEDIGKMVFNAELRANDDLERYHKAQAMYTAAEVSLGEFDPTFRLECARMAERERERRQQRKEARDKTKNGSAANGDKTYAPGTRRSARNNGQEPDFSITDPVQLERKLKRQRSTEGGESSNNSGDDVTVDPAAKRTRLEVIEEVDDRDPIDCVGPTSSQPRPRTRTPVDLTQNTPTPDPSSQMDLGNIIIPDSATQPSPSREQDVVQQPLPSFSTYLHSHATANPSALFSLESSQHVFSLQSTMPLPLSENFIASQSIPVISVEPTSSPGPTDSLLNLSEQPTAMDVEFVEPPPRTPSPLPVFHVDEFLLEELRSRLISDTDSLTIEQLEQLRAISLGCIWRHRQSWDRDELVVELKGVLEEFVEEVSSFERELYSD